MVEDIEALDVVCPKCGAVVGRSCIRRMPFSGIAHNARARLSDKKAGRPMRPLDRKIGISLGRDMRTWGQKNYDRNFPNKPRPPGGDLQ